MQYTTQQQKIDSNSTGERFINLYINNLIRKYRCYSADEYNITINGLKEFIKESADTTFYLCKKLGENKFFINIEGCEKSLKDIVVNCVNNSSGEVYDYRYQVQNLPLTIELASKTQISVVAVIVMKIVAHTIVKNKILYKAIIFDLDETLWKGTLTEDGFEKIQYNLNSNEGIPFISFMNFIKFLAEELGIFIAVNSRNTFEEVKNAIEQLDEKIFPLKNQIDCIIANDNDKSENIKEISKELALLPESMIFIDDNQIIRDEVMERLPGVFVLQWTTHEDLMTQLIISCVFERNELSINSQQRRKQFREIKTERLKTNRPELLVKIKEDIDHDHAIELYTKSNQFKFTTVDRTFVQDARSIYFELYRQNGESLGICSALTYGIDGNDNCIYNWAISCRFFEIGLEEFVVLHLQDSFKSGRLVFNYSENERNTKIAEFLKKYSEIFEKNDNQVVINFTKEIIDTFSNQTNLKQYNMDKQKLYTIGYTLLGGKDGIEVEEMFGTLRNYNISHLVDVRSVPFSKQYPQCDSMNLRLIAERYGIVYVHMPELGAKASLQHEVFSKASDIFFDDIFPIAGSRRPEKTQLMREEEIVDFNKFRNDEFFLQGIKRIEDAYDKNFTIALMCSEKNPINCHRYFLISKKIEEKFGDWLQIEHIVESDNGEVKTVTNKDLDKILSNTILDREEVKKIGLFEKDLFKGNAKIDNYFGNDNQSKINDFCDRYWNLMHGWKKSSNNNRIEDYD